MFYVSLLKDWRTASLQEDQPVPTDVPNVEEPYYEIERILRWRKVKRNNLIDNLIDFKRIFGSMERISGEGGYLDSSGTI